jgi:hypothetical protein
MKNRKKSIIQIVVVMVLVFGSLYYLYSKGTYTAYETLTNGKITPNMAKWNISVDGFKVTSSDVQTIGLSNITWNSSNAVNGKALPGSTGTVKITIDPLDTDVAIKYTFEIVDKNVDDTKFLKVTNINDNGNNLIRVGENVYTGIFSLDDIKKQAKKELTFDVEWPLGEDIDPTSEEVNSSINFLVINFSVEQYKGEAIVPYSG